MTELALPSSLTSPILFDRSSCGRIRLTGADRVRFLHNQTTQNIEQLSAGEGCNTVFVTATGRTIDLATTYAFADSLLVVVSPGMAKQLYDWMDRYIFFSDKVTLTDESAQTFQFTLLGDDAGLAIQSLSNAACTKTAPFSHTTLSLLDQPASKDSIMVAVGSGLSTNGYTLIGPQAQAEMVQNLIAAAGVETGSAAQWEKLRIQQGRPAPGQELTDDDNPLEAGLWHSISFEKGCYIGQETIARLNTYKGVKKRLWGLELSGPVEPGAAIFVEDAKVGRVTSVVAVEDGTVGLGYLRTKAGGEGMDVMVEAVDQQIAAKTYALPFVSHEYYTSAES